MVGDGEQHTAADELPAVCAVAQGRDAAVREIRGGARQPGDQRFVAGNQRLGVGVLAVHEPRPLARRQGFD